MAERVQAQYEAYPYPPRDPKDEAKRLVVGSPGVLAEIDHYLFAGRLRARPGPLRVLVAGGGTGDATVMLAQQAKDAGLALDLTYLDLSNASRAVAEARVRARGLDGVTFLTGSLLDPPVDGPFDYIDCCGVLHHLDDPQEGFDRLAGLLAPDGGMGIMVYGPLGRTGVYPLQAAIRALSGEDAAPEARLGVAKTLLQGLPPGNWFARNPFLGDQGRGDAALYDLLCHSTDRAFSVPELAESCARAGLRIVRFIEPLRYDPALYLRDPALRARAEALDPIARAALAEQLAGFMATHVVYAARADNPADTVAAPASDRAIPVFRDAELERAARAMRGPGRLGVDFGGLKADLALPAMAGPILRAVDGRRTLAQIQAMMPGGPDWLAFKAQFDALYGALNPANKLLLRIAP